MGISVYQFAHSCWKFSSREDEADSIIQKQAVWPFPFVPHQGSWKYLAPSSLKFGLFSISTAPFSWEP